MADLEDPRVLPDLVESIRLTNTPEKFADAASLRVISSFVTETAEVDDQFQQVARFHGDVSEEPQESISCGNKSSRISFIEQEDSRYHTCKLRSDINDPNYTRHNDRCFMHEHLLFDLLLWLPVISLLRFKSVCKTWCALIDSTNFVNQHFSHSCNKDCLLGSIKDIDYDSIEFCLLSGSKYEMYSNVDYAPQWFKDPTLVDSCNGIVCLGIENNLGAALWNPATRQLRRLPEPSVEPHTFASFGFGFDVKSNDYKVVRCPFESDVVEVYSLRSNSWIKTIQDVLPGDVIYRWITKNKHGKCFWIGCTDYYDMLLISFDLNDEVLETMPLPGDSFLYHALDFLGDKLVYMSSLDHHFSFNHHQYFELWVLDEYGGKKSWNKLCKLGPTCDGLIEMRYPRAFSRNGEFLLHNSNVYEGEVHLYDFVARENDKYVENKIQDPNPYLSHFIHYNESLVSIERADGAY